MGKVIAAVLLSLCAAASVSAVPIAEAKSLPDGAPVSISGVVIHLDTTECYMQDPTRCAGILVMADTAALEPGDLVDVNGLMATIGGERAVSSGSIVVSGTGAAIRSLAMSNRGVGGAPFGLQGCVMDYRLVYSPEGEPYYVWMAASGLNNTGLPVTTWGTVTGSYSTEGGRWFYIDDGYCATADLCEDGILVYSPADVRPGDYVKVTGISSVEPALDDAAKLIRVIRPASQTDLAVVKPGPLYNGLLSDEFDGPTLSRHWAVANRYGIISAAADPGWLRMRCLEDEGNPWAYNTYAYYGCELVQPICGDWDLEVKLRADVSPDPLAVQRVAVEARKLAFPHPSAGPAPVTLCSIVQDIALHPHKVTAGTSVVGAYNGETVFVRMHRRADTVTVDLSFDGYNYETDVGSASVSETQYVAIAAMSYNKKSPTDGRSFTGYCDYFRLTPYTGE